MVLCTMGFWDSVVLVGTGFLSDSRSIRFRASGAPARRLLSSESFDERRRAPASVVQLAAASVVKTSFQPPQKSLQIGPSHAGERDQT